MRALFGRQLGELRLQGRLSGLADGPRGPSRASAATSPRAPRSVPASSATARVARRLEKRLVQILFARFEAPRDMDAPRRGRALARRAEAWLRQNLAEPPTIADALRGAPRQRAHAPRGVPGAPGRDAQGLPQDPAPQRGASRPPARRAQHEGDGRGARLGLRPLRLVLAGLPAALRARRRARRCSAAGWTRPRTGRRRREGGPSGLRQVGLAGGRDASLRARGLARLESDIEKDTLARKRASENGCGGRTPVTR